MAVLSAIIQALVGPMMETGRDLTFARRSAVIEGPLCGTLGQNSDVSVTGGNDRFCLAPRKLPFVIRRLYAAQRIFNQGKCCAVHEWRL